MGMFRATVERRDRTVTESEIQDSQNGTWKVSSASTDRYGDKLEGGSVRVEADCGEVTYIAPAVAIALAEEVIRVAKSIIESQPKTAFVPERNF